MSHDFSDGFFVNPDFLKNRLEESTGATDEKKAPNVTDETKHMLLEEPEEDDIKEKEEPDSWIKHIPPEMVKYINSWVSDLIKHDPRFRDLDFAKLVRETALKLGRPLTGEEIDMMYKVYSNEKQRETGGIILREPMETEGINYEQDDCGDDYEMER